MALLCAPNGMPIHFIVQIVDLTETVRASRAKDEFVTHVSHELRTPLASAMAHLELMEDSGDLSASAQRHVTAVRRNVARLSHFVADVLFATRASSGSSLVDPYRLDVVTVVAEALDAARVDAAIGGVTLEADLPDSLVAHVDGIRLRQVVDNLIANSIAYTPRDGHVVVALRADDRELTLVVEDNGEGVAPQDLLSIFDPFSRGENATSRQIPGTGLGLHIVKTIAEAHGGTVSVASQVGLGSSFRITLPADERPRAPGPDQHAPIPEDGGRSGQVCAQISIRPLSRLPAGPTVVPTTAVRRVLPSPKREDPPHVCGGSGRVPGGVRCVSREVGAISRGCRRHLPSEAFANGSCLSLPKHDTLCTGFGTISFDSFLSGR